MSHKFDLKKNGEKRTCRAGYRILVHGGKFPGLQNMALAEILLKKGGIREPHWHPNANEMTYCARGKALITVFSPKNKRESFILNKGEVVYFPKGYIHHIENIHEKESRFILAYDNGKPEDLDLTESGASMTARVLAATFSGEEKKIEKLVIDDVFISQRKSAAAWKDAAASNRHKFNLERIQPQIKTKGGLARIANRENFPLLDHLALFSLKIAKKGIREPHWHPNATELNFVVSGKCRLIVFSPGGEKDEFTLDEGQGSVIPAGYFHYIENIGKSELHMTVYFNNSLPDDIGLSGALSAFSNETLASIYSLDTDFFSKMNRFRKDRMIVCGGG